MSETVAEQVRQVLVMYVEADEVDDALLALTQKGLLLPEPRVWRAGGPVPERDVRAVLDGDGDVWRRDYAGGWEMGEHWCSWMTLTHSHGPLVEIILPAAVIE